MNHWPLTVGSKGFAIDPTDKDFSGPSSVPLLRAQADTGGRPGEGSLNREDFWRRSIVSWHHGAGQNVYDGEGSDPYRFDLSQGVDPWTEGELSVLPDVITVGAVASPGKLLVAPTSDGTYLYHLTGGTLHQWFSYRFDDPVYPTVVTGGDWSALTATASITDYASDGQYVYAATDGDGVFRMEHADVGLVSFNTIDVRQLWFVNNRLIAAKGPALYNILNGTPPSDAFYTHPHEFWYWNGVASASSYIYLSGASGWLGSNNFDAYTYSSQIYKTSVTNDEAAELDPPVIAAQLPDGETVQTIYGYAGFIFIGTNRGVRMAQPDNDGFLTYGSLLPLGNCTAFEGEENFIWVGASDPNETLGKTNLWRLDLRWFNAPLVPAYARDMESYQTTIVKPKWDACYVASIATFEGRRIWTQWGDRTGAGSDFGYMFLQSASEKAIGGLIRTGAIRFDLVEPKRPVGYTVSHHPLSDDAGTLLLAAYHDYTFSPNIYPAVGGLTTGSITTLFPGVTDGLTGSKSYTSLELALIFQPSNTITGITIKARPAPARSNVYSVPVMIQPVVENLNRDRISRDFVSDFEFLMAYAESGAREVFSLLGREFHGYIEDYKFTPDGMDRFDRNYKGTLTIKIREVD